MSDPKVIFGFHAVGVRLKTAPASMLEVLIDGTRRDARMKQFIDRAREAGVKIQEADGARLTKFAGTMGHQGVAARVVPIEGAQTVEEVIDEAKVRGQVPLVLVLDGVTDPHNLGACLRVADGAGAHAVIAPKDRSVGLTPTVAKVASGAADTVPYLMVTNLARTLGELKEFGLWVTGTSDQGATSVYAQDFKGPSALVLGAEGAGIRQLTAKTCDTLVRIPMAGAVESLNVSVAAGVCLFEVVRQRSA
jgi:23S rRNA (guanosine2251-2'-O)-methyltransferase